MAYIRCSGNIGGSLKVRTASGNPCTFETNLADKLVSLKATILASGGGGTPATPIPIVGYSSLNLTHCGVNLWDEEIRNGYYSNSGVYSELDSSIANKNPIKITPSTNYYCYSGEAGYQMFLFFYDADMTFISRVITAKNAVFTTPNNAVYMNFCNGYGEGGTYNDNISFNSDSTITNYEPYHGTPYLVQFGQTVYGGELDVTTGVLTITHKRIDLGSLNWNTSWYTSDEPLGRIFANLTHKKPGLNNLNCEIYPLANATDSYMSDVTITGNVSLGYIYIRDTNHATGADLVASLSGHYLVYELATPIEIDVSALSVDTIVGINNMFHDGNGDTEVKYLYKA